MHLASTMLAQIPAWAAATPPSKASNSWRPRWPNSVRLADADCAKSRPIAPGPLLKPINNLDCSQCKAKRDQISGLPSTGSGQMIRMTANSPTCPAISPKGCQKLTSASSLSRQQTRCCDKASNIPGWACNQPRPAMKIEKNQTCDGHETNEGAPEKPRATYRVSRSSPDAQRLLIKADPQLRCLKGTQSNVFCFAGNQQNQPPAKGSRVKGVYPLIQYPNKWKIYGRGSYVGCLLGAQTNSDEGRLSERDCLEQHVTNAAAKPR